MTEEIIMAGFGGQGVLLMGQLLTYAAMTEGKKVSWFPSYGPEMRGGTANCSVIISDEPIGTPIVYEPTIAVVLNLPSLDKFEMKLSSGGILLVNSSLIDKKVTRRDIYAYPVPINDMAMKLGNARMANMVGLGAFSAAAGTVRLESLSNAFQDKFAAKPHLLEANKKALETGYEYALRLKEAMV